MKGVILAGGSGTRLLPITRYVNKHLIPVWNKPMIYYPIQTLKDNGITDIIIVSGGENIGGFAELLGSGKELGVNLTYRVQEEAGGIAQALACVEGMVGDLFAVILGDNYFSEIELKWQKSPTVFVKEVNDPQRFGVFDPKTATIEEKPAKPKTNLVVTGCYIYDDTVFDFIKTLKPSARGEIEITDVNNWYLSRGQMGWEKVTGYWSDMGTFDSLFRVANRVKSV